MPDEITKGLVRMLEPVVCPKCGTQYKKSDTSVMICPKCGHEEISTFGKIKQYIDEHGTSTAWDISQATGISITKIEKYLREGRLEIPENSSVFIKCQKCGDEIRYGRFCRECALVMCKDLHTSLIEGEIGDKPKKNVGKMRFLGNDK